MIRGIPLSGALALAAVLAAGCGASPPRAVAVQPAAGGAGDLMGARDRSALAALAAQRTGGGLEGYKIGPDDLLEIRIPKLVAAHPTPTPVAAAGGATMPSVAAAPVFQQGVRVSALGDIALPHIGTVAAAGKTPLELERDIARRLVAAGILVNPVVTVQIAEHRSAVVAVMGSVEKPGLYPLTRPGATIADFISAAGGPTKEAGRVLDFKPAAARDERGEPIVIDLGLLLKQRDAGPTAMNPVAAAGDVLTVPPAGSVLVDGWVEKPGSYPVTRGLTLTGAVAAAGGSMFPADRRQVTVKRTLGGPDQQLFTVDLDAVASGRQPDFPITDGDVVHLPLSPGKAVPWGVFQAAKEAIHIGASFPIF